MNAALYTALKDCTKAIALADTSTAALDSRASIYWRMNKPDDALADLAAAHILDPRIEDDYKRYGIVP